MTVRAKLLPRAQGPPRSFPTWEHKSGVTREGAPGAPHLGGTPSPSLPLVLGGRGRWMWGLPRSLHSLPGWGIPGARVSSKVEVLTPPMDSQVPPQILSPSPARDPRPLTLLSLPTVIAVCVKEEHLDATSPGKAATPELPIPVEHIKQETHD